ncbi:MAG TPA: DUF4212 domain-containing protein [Myxococcales bacterium]|nr:hypothetical protein [Deltaproteobacteria bacterium]HAA58659.1 DUF4212 domain-containing protein [Myxococcales bacterium]|tara:strand:+ start:10655 stop:10921 length:267 start_codon:yes stop_codon:yes gene_type:complete
MSKRDRAVRYWKANIRAVWVLLVIWFVVSFGAGILFVEQLNKIKVAGFPLGFWFAQQGAIFVFVGLVFAYARWMDRLDRELDVEEEEG